MKRGWVERWREGGARGRGAVDERRSEGSGVEKDEVLGFNHFQRVRKKKRQMCGPEVAGGTPALLPLQYQSKTDQCSSSDLNLMSRHEPGETFDSTHFFSPSCHSTPCFHRHHNSRLDFFSVSLTVAASLSDGDKRLNLILWILKLISPRSQGTSRSSTCSSTSPGGIELAKE